MAPHLIVCSILILRQGSSILRSAHIFYGEHLADFHVNLVLLADVRNRLVESTLLDRFAINAELSYGYQKLASAVTVRCCLWNEGSQNFKQRKCEKVFAVTPITDTAAPLKFWRSYVYSGKKSHIDGGVAQVMMKTLEETIMHGRLSDPTPVMKAANTRSWLSSIPDPPMNNPQDIMEKVAGVIPDSMCIFRGRGVIILTVGKHADLDRLKHCQMLITWP